MRVGEAGEKDCKSVTKQGDASSRFVTGKDMDQTERAWFVYFQAISLD